MFVIGVFLANPLTLDDLSMTGPVIVVALQNTLISPRFYVWMIVGFLSALRVPFTLAERIWGFMFRAVKTRFPV